jgi:uncharacterized protein YneF (UPF0154 family)
MNKQKGKITFLGLVVFLVMVLVAFMAFKYIASSIEKKQIHKDVIESLGAIRGASLSDTMVRETIERVLNESAVKTLEIYSELGRTQGKIYFSYKYEVSVNYFLFKHSEIVAVEEEIDNHGG